MEQITRKNFIFPPRDKMMRSYWVKQGGYPLIMPPSMAEHFIKLGQLKLKDPETRECEVIKANE